jgi:hypothetical protein
VPPEQEHLLTDIMRKEAAERRYCVIAIYGQCSCCSGIRAIDFNDLVYVRNWVRFSGLRRVKAQNSSRVTKSPFDFPLAARMRARRCLAVLSFLPVMLMTSLV